MAGTTRLELATSAVTGQRSNQLNYVPTRQINNVANNIYLNTEELMEAPTAGRVERIRSDTPYHPLKMCCSEPPERHGIFTRK